MANTKIKATAQLFLDISNAKDDAKQFIGDLKKQLASIETAADKMTVFKDLVSYIAMADRALAALRDKNEGAFKHMFDGMDADFRKQFESLFGVSGDGLSKLDVLREKLQTLTPKSGIAELRKFAESINTIFSEMNVAAPFDIESEFKGKATQAHIDKLTTALSNFATVWDGVRNKIKDGFTFGGLGGPGGGGGFTGITRTAEDISAEIDDLSEQASRLKSLKEDIAQSLSDIELAESGELLGDSVKLTEKQVIQTINIFNKLRKQLKEFKGDKTSPEYFEMLAQYSQSAAEVYEIYGKLTDVDSDNYKVLQRLRKTQITGTDKTYGDAVKAAYTNAADVVEEGDMSSKLSSYLSSIDQQVDDISNKIGTLSVELTNIGTAPVAPSGFEDTKKDINEVLALAGQLKNMFATMSRRADIEYNVSINGLDIKALGGKHGQVDGETQAASYLDNIFSSSVMYGHTHKGGSKAFNIEDVVNSLNEYKKGLKTLSFVVGGDGINTLDLSGINVEDIDKIKNLVTALNSNTKANVVAQDINKIVEQITGVENVMREWRPQQLDDLAQYMQNVAQNAADALSPLEKFQLVLDSFFGKGKVDASKYEDLISGLTQDNARSVFNSIASMERLPKMDESLPLTMKQVSDAIDEAIAKHQKFRYEANLTYEEIAVEVARYMSQLRESGNVKQTDFFSKYFPEGEWMPIRGWLTDAYDGLLSIEEVQNRIANEFGVDPETFAKIPTGDKVGIGVDEAKAKVQEILSLAKEIAVKNFGQFWDARDNVEIGKYTERLENARTAFNELAASANLTEDEINEVNDAFDAAQQNLKISEVSYDGYGSGYGYAGGDYTSEEYDEATERARNAEDRARAAEERAEKAETDATAYEHAANETFEEKLSLELENERLRAQLSEQQNTGAAANEISQLEKATELLQKKKLTYEDILSLVKVYNDETSMKAAADAGDWESYDKMIDTRTDIARVLIPLDMMGMGSDSPDKWLSMVGISAEDAAQKLYELYGRMHAVDDLIEDNNDTMQLLEHPDGTLTMFEEDDDGSDMDDMDDIQKETGALEQKLEVLRDIADAYGAQITQKQRNRLVELEDKDADEGLTSREEDRMAELSEAIDEADANLIEFEDTYERIILKLSNGKKVSILPDDDGLRKLYKIANEYSEGEFNGFEIEDVEFVRQEQFLKTKIESYEELCDVVKRYNELKSKDRSEKEDREIRALFDRLSTTRVENPNGVNIDFDEWLKNFDIMSTDLDQNRLAQILGFAIPQAAEKAENAIADVVSEIKLFEHPDGTFTMFDDVATGAQNAEVKVEELSDTIENVSNVEGQISFDEYLADKTKYFEQPDGQFTMLDDVVADAHKAEVAVDQLGDAIEEATVVEGQIGFDEYLADEKHRLDVEQQIADEMREQVAIAAAIDNNSPPPNFGGTAVATSSSASEDPKTAAAGGGTPPTEGPESAELNMLQEAVENVKKAVNDKTDAFREEGQVVDQVVGGEIDALIMLEEAVDSARKAVGKKTSAFKKETSVVNNAVLQEVDALIMLEEAVNGVKNAVNDKTNAFKEEGSVVDQASKQEAGGKKKQAGTDADSKPGKKSGNAESINREKQAHNDNADAIKEEAAAQKEANDVKKTGYEILKDYWRTTSGQSETAVEGNAKNILDRIIGATFNQDQSLRNLKFSKFGDPNNIDHYAEQYKTLDSVLQLIGYHLGELQPSMIDGAQWGFSAEIVANSEKVVANMEEARRILYGISDTPVVNDADKSGTPSGGDGSGDADIKNIEKRKALLSGMLNSIKSQFKSTKIDMNLDSLTQPQQDIADGYVDIIANLKQLQKTSDTVTDSQIQDVQQLYQALMKQIAAYKQQNSTVGGGKNKKYNDAVDMAQAQYNTAVKMTQPYADVNSPVVLAELEKYKTSLQELIRLQAILSGDNYTQGDVEEFNLAKKACDGYYKSLLKVVSESEKLEDNASKMSPIAAGTDVVSDEGKKAALEGFVKSVYGANAIINKFNGDYTKLDFTLKNGDGTINKMTASFNAARTAIGATTKVANQTSGAFDTFFGQIKSKFAELWRYMAARMGVDEIIQQVRKGLEYVKEIDSALTELKKVTDATDASYDNFLQSMSKTASVVGSTVSDLTTMAAEWARLGYSMEESATLAENTAVLLNVSEFDDATQASEALISTMQAFQYTADESGHVVDILNEVGNNYAISSDGIATALQDSASALMEGGNNLEQATALVAAANRVVQDPNSVGSALRTISLRLRGTSVEVLEEMGEETDGVVESTSKLQEKIQALSGVDILTDAGDYKDTYTILREIGNVWEDMSDIDQAALLELMAGKNRANTLSAILSNMEDLEGAYESAMNAEGSALRENETYLDSIQGKIDLFTNELQTFWMNTVSSDMVKGIVSLGTSIVELVNKIGLIPTVLGGVALYFTAIKKNNPVTVFKDLLSTIQQYNSAVQQISAINKVTSPVGMSIDQFNAGPVNAYANAVSNLTAKQQAATLAAAGLNSEQIKSVLVANGCDDANIKLAMSEASVAQATGQTTAATGIQILAATAKQKSTLSQNAANFLLAYSTEEVTEELLNEAVAAGLMSVEDKKLILASMGVIAANNSQAFSWKALGVAIKSAFMSNPVGMILTLATTIASIAIPIFNHFYESADELSDKVQELTNTYNEAKKEFSENIEILTVSSDEDTYATLLDEFKELTKGVNKYGENISLTSDQYERYKEICEAIVGINPSIVDGYDSATSAIGRNVSVLEQLIEKQKEQARLNAAEYVSYGIYSENGNFEDMADNAINAYDEAKDTVDEYIKGGDGIGLDNILYDAFHWEDRTDISKNKYGQGMASSPQKLAETILSSIGYDETKISEAIAKRTGTDGFNWAGFVGDYAEEILNSKDKIITALEADKVEEGELSPIDWTLSDDDEDRIKYNKEIDKSIEEIENWVDAYKDATRSLEAAQGNMVDALLQVPYALEEYDSLSDSTKSFITEWIKNSEIFKIDESTTQEDILAAKQTIINTIRDIANGDYTVETNKGNVFTAQDILDQLFAIDPSSVDFGKYKEQVMELLYLLWEAIGGADNEFGYGNVYDMAIAFGFDLVVPDDLNDEMSSFKERVAELTGKSADEIQKWLDSLPPEVVSRLLQVDLSAEEAGTHDFNSIEAMVKPEVVAESDTANTYSKLSEQVENYNDIVSQTNEIVSDNTEITQEYKDSLKDLGISEEELSECFDENNGLVVKNSKALNKLVREAKNATKNNITLAKSQARLEYYDLVKQLSGALDGTKKLDGATRNAVYSTLEQIDAVQKALYQYQLLEDTLLGVNNAFKEYNEAKEIDALNTYGDSYVEMAQTMYDGLYKTGQVGTEQFWASVEALVPTEVYQGLKEDSDRMKAIYDYYNKNILPSLRLKDDELSMDSASIENFVKDAIDAGVFKGDRKDFDLVEGMNLEKAAELMKMTKTQAYAFFAELDKYNTSSTEPSFLSQLDDSIEGRITSVTNKVEDLNKQKLALLEDGGYDKNKDKIQEIDQQIQAAEKDLNSLGQEAYTTWQKYTTNEAALAALEEISNKSQKISEVWPKELITELGLNGDMTVEEAYNRLLQKQLELEEPTVLTATLAIENIDAQIDSLKAKLSAAESDPAVLGVAADADQTTIDAAKQKIQDQIQALEEDMVVLSTTFGIELSEEQKASVQAELDAVETFKIHDKEFKVILDDASVSETNKKLQSVVDAAKKIKDKTISITTYETKYSRTRKQKYNPITDRYEDSEANGTAHANGTAYKNGSWGAPKTETALVGELGPELLVRQGRWTTIGDNGAEFTQIKKGDIIFNHKQTEDLLSKGYVTGRGKAYASGTAYSGLWRPTSPNKSQSNKPGNDFTDKGNRLFDAADSLSSAAGSISSASDEFHEVFDWIAVRLEEINEDIDFKSAKLENAVGYSDQNKIVADMIKLNEKLYDNLEAGYNKYNAYAQKLLAKVPKAYREAAQDGSIAIEEFVGKTDEKTLEAIQNYRDWAQKAADAAQQAQETITEISNLAKQAIDNIATDYENKSSLRESRIEQLEAYNGLSETTLGAESSKIYEAIIKQNKSIISDLSTQRSKMEAELDAQVDAGNIKKYSQNWYDAVNEIAAVDTEIIELTTELNDLQDSINELHWDQFDYLMDQFNALADEADNLIDILGTKDVVDDDANWTNEGITQLGLYAQKMEVAEKQAAMYADEIDYLNKNWKKLGYTEQEYIEKLNELKDGQYESIQAYHDSKDAIVDLTEARVDAIKEGIEREIDAYSELIEKKKEELDAEKD